MSLRRRRPAPVTILSIGVLTVAVLNGTRAVWLWQRRDFLSTLSVSAPIGYLIAAALFWAGAWAAAGVGLWRMAGWARWLVSAGVVLYHAHNWIVRWVFEVSEYARLVWPWHALITFFSVAFTLFILWRPRTRRRFENLAPE